MTEIEYLNTKNNSLIGAGTVVSGTQLQSYLSKLYPSLKIQEWLNDAKRNHSSTMAKSVFKRICDELGRIVEQSKHYHTNPTNVCPSAPVENNLMNHSCNWSMNGVNNSYNGSHSVTYSVTGLQLCSPYRS